ncbi:GNAT family N-acetyltransferase [Aerococcus urinaehominis]|uniref:GNAT family N-acetyltransferase n=1 Tax=Aerococcus urinaehominis TaxID=128944 RepID=UPI0009EA7AF1
MQKAVQENYFTIELHAQLPVIEFYQDLGFSSQGEVFEEAGIQHITMTLTINPKI